MSTTNYTASLHTAHSPQEAYNAINNVSAWWTQDIEGRSQQLNDVFTVTFGETFITMKITELVPGQKMTWLVTDCHKHWLKDKKEWKGTTISWELSAEGEGTQIRFTHIGLVPGLECYNGCEKGWNFYLKESLQKLLADGKGQPDLKAKETPPADFSITITVDQSPAAAFTAINNVRAWWSENIEGNTNKPGDEFTYHHQDIHYCQVKLVEMIPDKEIAWLVKYNYFKFTKDKSEWTGTKISFDISGQDGKADIRFTHHGLTPALECYDICSNAWTQYIGKSLLDLITTGQGQPNSKECEPAK